MNEWENILDPDILKMNINIASLFILYFETLNDYIVDQAQSFYLIGFHMENGEHIKDFDSAYETEVLQLNRRYPEDASLKWFMRMGAIDTVDYKKFHECRKRRNDITHQLLRNLTEGFKFSDIQLLKELILLYEKLDRWWINNVEIPIAGDDIPEDYEPEGVAGGQAIVLKIISDVALDNGDQYQELLKQIKESSFSSKEAGNNCK